MSKPVLHLIENPFDWKQVAKLYTQMTGKTPTAVEIEEMKKILAGDKKGLTHPPPARS
jgi:hypothetical protein